MVDYNGYRVLCSKYLLKQGCKDIKELDSLCSAILELSKDFINTLPKNKYCYLELPKIYVDEDKKNLYYKAMTTLGLELRFEDDIILYR